VGGGAQLSTSLSDVRSAELYRRALNVLPGGVNSPVRAMRSIGRDPIFIERAAGAEITDVDGNFYVDYVCSWGPLIHGHAHPAVLEAITDAAALGTTFGAATAGEVELAELVAQRMPAVDMLRMTSSGTEASMSAIRVARAATGRDKLLKFAGAYHGHVDGLLAEAGSGLATQGIPASPGVPAAATAATVVVPWNDPGAVRAAFAEHELAAVLCEPYPANMGLVPPAAGFLELLRELCTEHGVLLIFDEVITGFRVSLGGAQELSGVMPDLTVMGKVIGGGLPAAAYGGSTELMQLVAPAGAVYQAGTLSGNPLAVAAGRAALALLDEEAYLALSATTLALAEGLREAAGVASRAGGPHHGTAHGLLLRAARARLRGRDRVRRGGLRRVVPGAARPRRLPAPVAVRGMVPVPRAHARPRHPHGRGRRRGVRRDRPVSALARLAEVLREEGGLPASVIADAPEAETPHGDAAAAGSRAAGHEAEFALLVEAIREGYLQHYGEGRVVRAEDPDLGLAGGRPPLRARSGPPRGARRPRGRGRARRPHLALCAGSRGGCPRARRRRMAGRSSGGGQRSCP
jgi:glutamate-1-semialdehyde 2,1-aminomutase